MRTLRRRVPDLRAAGDIPVLRAGWTFCIAQTRGAGRRTVGPYRSRRNRQRNLSRLSMPYLSRFEQYPSSGQCRTRLLFALFTCPISLVQTDRGFFLCDRFCAIGPPVYSRGAVRFGGMSRTAQTAR